MLIWKLSVCILSNELCYWLIMLPVFQQTIPEWNCNIGLIRIISELKKHRQTRKRQRKIQLDFQTKHKSLWNGCVTLVSAITRWISSYCKRQSGRFVNPNRMRTKNQITRNQSSPKRYLLSYHIQVIFLGLLQDWLEEQGLLTMRVKSDPGYLNPRAQPFCMEKWQ